MLYDKRWDAKVEADPFSLDSLIAWLEKKPATDTYCYVSNGHCLLAQYFTAHGYSEVIVLPGYFWHADGGDKFSTDFEYVAGGGRGNECTFDAALKRARRRHRV